MAAVILGALRAITRVARHSVVGVEAIVAIRCEPPDLIVVDVGPPDLDAVAVCRALREETHVPIIVLGVRRSERDAVQALGAGADDYVAKPFAIVELQARVQAQVRRAHLYRVDWRPDLIELGELSLDLARRIATRDGRELGLTPVEWQLLRVLAINAGRTLTHRQIVHAVWGNVFGDAQQNLRVHIAHLRRKVERVASAPSIIVTEPGIGYRVECPAVAARPPV